MQTAAGCVAPPRLGCKRERQVALQLVELRGKWVRSGNTSGVAQRRSELMNGWLLAGTTFLASAVEAVEALTIVLAVGYTRTWSSSLWGAATGFITLLAIVALAGPAIVAYVPLAALKLAIGVFLLVFGLAWLRKAILRYSGRKALHDEEAIYGRSVEKLQSAVPTGSHDRVGFATSFNAVLLEGLEVAVIVLTFGSTAPAGFWWSGIGAIGAVIIVVVAGFVVRKPFGRIPENTMKFAVGIMLTSFGTLWAGEGLGIAWWGADLSLLWIVATFLAVSGAAVTFSQRRLRAGEARP
jgi:uncharacterized membrane protein